MVNMAHTRAGHHSAGQRAEYYSIKNICFKTWSTGSGALLRATIMLLELAQDSEIAFEHQSRGSLLSALSYLEACYLCILSLHHGNDSSGARSCSILSLSGQEIPQTPCSPCLGNLGTSSVWLRL